ncbi:hypothetical protein Bbelb_245180 [Branchiostoma belcheri]|nr:hypothetical protein Bbelb_245180 [Branchiostoma belcheri]
MTVLGLGQDVTKPVISERLKVTPRESRKATGAALRLKSGPYHALPQVDARIPESPRLTTCIYLKPVLLHFPYFGVQGGSRKQLRTEDRKERERRSGPKIVRRMPPRIAYIYTGPILGKTVSYI